MRKQLLMCKQKLYVGLMIETEKYFLDPFGILCFGKIQLIYRNMVLISYSFFFLLLSLESSSKVVHCRCSVDSQFPLDGDLFQEAIQSHTIASYVPLWFELVLTQKPYTNYCFNVSVEGAQF